MKNKIFKAILLTCFIPTAIVLAEYIPLETLPSIGRTPPSTNLSGYLQWLFTFGISFAGIAAVAMIVVGGVQYITAYGNSSVVQSAKNRITQALLGLLLAICAWLILYTINPDLINGGLDFSQYNLQDSS